MVELQRPRILEIELMNIQRNVCPAQVYDTEYQAKGCTIDGKLCLTQDRTRCNKYMRYVLPRRMVLG